MPSFPVEHEEDSRVGHGIHERKYSGVQWEGAIIEASKLVPLEISVGFTGAMK